MRYGGSSSCSFKAGGTCCLVLWTLVVLVTTERALSQRSSSSFSSTATHSSSRRQSPVPSSSSFNSSRSSSLSSSNSYYTAFDDASWAITSTNLSTTILSADKQALYNDFVQTCRNNECDDKEEAHRIYMNRHQPSSVYNYTTSGFHKVQAPLQLMQLLHTVWDRHQEDDSVVVEDTALDSYYHTAVPPTTYLSLHDHGGPALEAAIAQAARSVLEEWTGQRLAASSVYGIRIYHNQSILTPHVDRLPLVCSAILNVAQDVEEDWMLEVYGHEGHATNVTMQPGDMVLYESHATIHGRPFPLHGRYYANVFVHFQPMGPAHSTQPILENANGTTYPRFAPPFVVPGSVWETQYYQEFPRGWTLLTDLEQLASHGDVYTLQYVVQRQVDLVTDPQRQCNLLYLAIQNRHVELVHYLIHDLNYTVNLVCHGQTPLDWSIPQQPAQSPEPRKDHSSTTNDNQNAIRDLLIQYGAQPYDQLIRDHPQLRQVWDDPCQVMSALVWTLEGDDEDDDEDDEDEVEEILDFFFHHLEYNVNMICFRTAATPLDLVAAWKKGDGLHGGGMGRYLQRQGGTYQSALTDSRNQPQRQDSRCNVMQEAIEYGSIAVLDFLLDTLHYDIQMQCTDSLDEEEDDDEDDEDEEDQEEEPEQEEKDADRLETRDMDKEDNDNDPDTNNNNNNKRLRTPLDVALDTFQDHSHEVVLHLTNWGALTHRQWQYYEQRRNHS